MAGRKDALRGISNFKSRGHRLVALVPPEHALSDIDTSGSEPDNEEEIAHRTEELSSSPCPSIDSSLERMNLLDSSENDTKDNSLIDSDETYVDVDTVLEVVNENLDTQVCPSINNSDNNPVLEVEKNLNHDRPPLTPIFNNVLPPTGEVNYNAIPSVASLLSNPSPNASSLVSPSTSRTTRRKRNLPVRPVQKKPLKQFEQIRRNIHFVDNINSDEDRYYKIRPFIEKIRQNCLATEEETKFSIDEMTIPYKGTKAGNRKQYNPMKPNKWGFKNIVRAGASGIVYDFLLYGGDDTFRYIDFTEEEEQMTLGARMVLALCKTIQTPGSAVYFDNYFTTLDLIWYLRELCGIFSLGTIRQNRLKGCTKKLLSDKELKKRGRVSFSQVVDNDKKVAIVKWYDNKVVTLACSYADAYPVQEIKRWSKEQKKKINVTCPQLVRHYNQHMGGVDLCDMLIALYRTSFKSRRWYMNIFGQMLDIAVNNAWLLYRRKCNARSLKNINMKKFRHKLAVELRQKERSIETEPVPKKALIKTPTAPRPPVSVRYDGNNHWPQYTTYGRCKFCKNNKTNIHCSKCKQRLCLVAKRNCFYNFHNK